MPDKNSNVKSQKSKVRYFSTPRMLAGRSKSIYRGFTLIELMIAIAIIAVIATTGFVFYEQGQRSARNSKRAEDLKSISAGLEIYKSTTGKYPIQATNFACLKSVTASPPLIPDFLKVVPDDPLFGPGRDYCYQYRSDDGYDYKLRTDPNLSSDELKSVDLDRQKELVDPATLTASASKNWAVYTGGAASWGGGTTTPTPSGGTPVSSPGSSAPPGGTALSVSVNKLNAAVGETLNVTWSNVPDDRQDDWVGLFPISAPDEANSLVGDKWKYLTCAGSPAPASGTCQIAMPNNPGSYNFRLFANTGYTSKTAFTEQINVSNLAVNPTNVTKGNSIAISFGGVSNPTTTDWFTLWPSGGTTYTEWIYASSCSKSLPQGTAAKESGSCSFTIPASSAPGSYTIKFYAANGTATLISQSIPFTVN